MNSDVLHDGFRLGGLQDYNKEWLCAVGVVIGQGRYEVADGSTMTITSDQQLIVLDRLGRVRSRARLR